MTQVFTACSYTLELNDTLAYDESSDKIQESRDTFTSHAANEKYSSRVSPQSF